MDTTRLYYENNADVVCKRYEAVSPEVHLHFLNDLFPRNARVLELGCGSGRDGAYLVARGIDWVGVESAAAMTTRALYLHPELQRRILHCEMQQRLPFDDACFQGAFSLAALMHLTPVDVVDALSEAWRVLMDDAPFVISVPTRRADVNESCFDANGRYFLPWDSGEWKAALAGAHFELEKSFESKDLLGRDMSWLTLISRKREGMAAR